MKVDLQKLNEAVAKAPPAASEVAKRVRRQERKTVGSLRERLDRAAHLALDSIEEHLDTYVVDEKGNEVPLLEQKEIMKNNRWLVGMAPAVQVNKNPAPIVKIELAVGSMESAKQSASYVRGKVTGASQKVIEGEVQDGGN